MWRYNVDKLLGAIAMSDQPLWHKEAVYQIYPRSFCDSNGDGIGDIPGIISKLDYLKSLGVGIIWLSPIYASPLDDLGYDISDYYKIHPDYGTMDDFDNLVKEADKRGLKIVMDLVVNHTSDEHQWFQESMKKDSPYHDYYYWREGKKPNGKQPPNNWTSMFTGSAWQYVPSVGEWYLHLYSKKQPDLNYHNPKVIEEVEKILNFYFDKGVYGFRCDVINQIYKESLEDGKGHSFSARGIEHYLMKEGNHQILRKLYEDVFSKRDCVVIGETYAVDFKNGYRFLADHEMDMFFQFELMGVDQSKGRVFSRKFKTKNFKRIAYEWQKNIPWNANYLENHDQTRSISRFGDEKRFWKQSGKALALFNLTLRGTPFIYEGEEIGMLNKPMGEPENSRDVCALYINSIAKKMLLPRFWRKRLINRVDRDHARTPMQWDKTTSAGFSSTTSAWIPVNPNYLEGITVEDENNDPDSILSFYRKLFSIRRQSIILQEGDFEPLSSADDVIAFRRNYEGGSMMTLINLSGKEHKLGMKCGKLSGKVILSNYPGSHVFLEMTLRPYEAILLQL